LAAFIVLLAGCSSEITEQTLVGAWQASSTGAGKALKIKSENPNAKSADVLAAAKLLSATTLEITKDGYSLMYGVNKFEGTWKFDKDAGLVELDVKTQNGEVADPKTSFTTGFLAIVDQKDQSMRLFPGTRNTYEELKRNGDKGANALNIKLRRA
jgi:hypothetical protein